MKKSVLFIAGFSCLSVFASADQLYGLSSSTPGTVFQVDKATGNATSVVNLTGASFSSIVDIEFLGGVAYACDVFAGSAFTFGSIDLSTGAYTVLSNQDGSANWWGLASKESAGILYTVDFNAGNVLKSVTTGGVTTTIGATGINAYGMTYDSLNSVLYATDGGSLYTLNEGTGASSFVGGFVNAGGNGDLAYDVASDTLYYNDGSKLFTVDRATGLATLVGSNNQPNFNIDGLGSLRPVPEPASMAALGLGLAALVRRRKANK